MINPLQSNLEQDILKPREEHESVASYRMEITNRK